MAMIAKVYAVEFLEVGKEHYFSFEGELKKGDLVLGISFFGLDVGKVLWGPKEMDIENLQFEVKPILRKLTENDIEQHETNKKNAEVAYEICKKNIKDLMLPMKLLKSVYMFDNSKLLFYFSAEGRVDFRELVKELAREFKTRIELRQVGVRDELKFIGAIGMCGQPVCCKRFLRDFDTITLKDAKKQQLMINPAKISGQCRRLLCCLRFETDSYNEMMYGIPGQGSIIEYDGKVCKVLSSNVFTKTVTVQADSGENNSIPFDYFINEKPKIILDAGESDEDYLETLPDED